MFATRLQVKAWFAPLPILSALVLAASPRPVDAQPMNQSESNSVKWIEAMQLGVEGRGWEDTRAPYDRLPAHAAGVVREPVWRLSRHSSGMYVRFSSDAELIRVRWVLTNPWLHLPNIEGEHLFGDDGEGSTDGSHPNDLGFMRQAAVFEKTLAPLLRAE